MALYIVMEDLIIKILPIKALPIRFMLTDVARIRMVLWKIHEVIFLSIEFYIFYSRIYMMEKA
jgi:hypothetical protein